MPGNNALLAALVAVLGLVAASGCDTRKRLEAPQGDTPNDTDQAPIHVRLFSAADGNSTAIHSLRATSDGGYIAVGYTGDSAWIFKTNAQGSIEWQEAVGGFGGGYGVDRFNDVQIALDGGYVAAGRLSDRAIVVKFRVDGSIEWHWSGTRPPPFQSDPPDDYWRRSAEALTISVKAAGAGYVVAGGIGLAAQRDETPLGDGNWVMELTADGEPGRLLEISGQPSILMDGEAHDFIAPDEEGGVIEAVVSWPLSGSSPVDGGFWMAGRTANGQMLVAQAQNGFHPLGAPSVRWKRSFGPGTFHALRVIERTRPDGTREQHLLLVGETPDGILVGELQALTGEVLWAKRISGDGSDPTGWTANSMQPTPDGGFVLAAATERAPAVLKLDGAGNIVWQYEYAPYQRGLGGDRGQAMSIHVRADGGYRVAGYQAMWHTFYGNTNLPGLSYYQRLAIVFDIDASGGIVVNEKSGWVRITRAATAATLDFEPVDPAGDFNDDEADLISSDDDETDVGASATDLVIETASGPSGVLPAPPVGTNDQGRTFFWGNAPGASGFILYRSDDGIRFVRDNMTREYDFDLYGSGYVKIAAFNGTGYSDYSTTLGPLGSSPPPPPSSVRLTVINTPNGGFVTSTPTGIACGTDCTGDFPVGSEVTLNLIEGELLRFSSWTGCDSTVGRQCTVNMNRNSSVTVNYTEPP
jgi:hypothetical protein